MWRTAISCLVAAGCTDAPRQAFVVDGFVDVATDPHASVIGLWEIPGTPPKYYKLGDGVRLNARFTLGFDVDPPPEALGPDGIGVALVAMLPELTTVPDGFVNQASLVILGVSSDTAIIYRTATSTGPAWTSSFNARFSCGGCVRTTAPHSYELIGCASVLVEPRGSELCTWF
jgi:hypothetical protein